MIRVFFAAPILVLILVLGLSSLARAETQRTWGGENYQSTITIEPTSAPGAVAQVRFANKTVHRDEVVSFVLDLDGLTVTVEALVGRGLTPDRMGVLAPPGYIAVPAEIDVAEDDTGVILILPFLG